MLGIVTTVAAIQQHRVPPFFPPGIFLVLDVLGVIGFGILTAWAIALRKQAAWHKRLMLCGTILVMSPALGRILPMPLLGSQVRAENRIWDGVRVDGGVRHRGHDLRPAPARDRHMPAYYWGGSVLVVTERAGRSARLQPAGTASWSSALLPDITGLRAGNIG